MIIGTKTKAMVVQQVKELLDTYQQKIETAYCSTDDPFSVSFKTKFCAAGAKGTKVTTQISFVESKVTDGLTEVVDEHQMKLFEDADKVTIHHGDKIISMEGKA